MRYYLIGFMGSGKSYWGRIWAKKNEMDFLDLDEMMEMELNLPIKQIFEDFGEAFFREKESALLKSTSKKEDIIIACGGGTPCYLDNMAWINANGSSVYLKATSFEIMNNLEKDKSGRPLIAGLSGESLRTFIEHKINERKYFYEQAKLVLETDTLSEQSFEEKILQKTDHA